MRQQPLQELLIALAVEDNHRHGPVAESPLKILSDDVFKKCCLARAGPSSNDAMLDAHGIRPEPRFFMDVVAEDGGLVANRSLDDGCVLRAGDRYGGMRPHLFALLTAA